MNFLYLTHARHADALQRDGSTRYRCFNYAEALLAKKHVAQVQHIDEATVATLVQFDVVIFLRPQLTRQTLRLLNSCEQNNILAIADYDDLIFAPDVAEQAPAVRCGQSSVDLVRQRFAKNRQVLQQFNYITVASKALQTRVLSEHAEKNVLHLPNGLSSYWLEYNLNVDTKHRTQGQLVYMPGSRSHDADFKSLQPILLEVMRELPNISLKLFGALNYQADLFNPDKVSHGPLWTDFEDLPQHLSKGFIALAPLEPTAFNECKSHIKFLESAAFGTPLFASVNQDLQQHSVDGLFFPTDLAAWVACLQELSEPDFYMHCSEMLKNYVREHCNTSDQIPTLLNFVKSNALSRPGSHSNTQDQCTHG